MARECCVSTLLSHHSKSELKREDKLGSQVVATGEPCAPWGRGPLPRGTVPAKWLTGTVYTDIGTNQVWSLRNIK